MVPLLRAEGAFHARVLAARLGSEGVVTQLRGSLDGPYPMGAVEVLVQADDLALAQALLLADEVEAAFPEGSEAPEALDASERSSGSAAVDDVAAVPATGPWLLVLGVVLLLVLPLVVALLG